MRPRCMDEHGHRPRLRRSCPTQLWWLKIISAAVVSSVGGGGGSWRRFSSLSFSSSTTTAAGFWWAATSRRRGAVEAFSTSGTSKSRATGSSSRVASVSTSSSRSSNSNSNRQKMAAGATTDTTIAATCSHVLSPLLSKLDYTWVTQLTEESPEDLEKSLSFIQRARGRDGEDSERLLKNQSMRPVFSGHYVRVEPTPLRNPQLVAYSADLASELGFGDDVVQSTAFAQFFSGNLSAAVEGWPEAEEVVTSSWATPYALSIMGTPYTSNCPFGTGDGYGDGRAISIAEISTEGAHYEFQLKGAGPTPWCRGADGRAVLRSSIREFLASEAMHHLGIATTRALSLVVSTDPDRDTSQRPWYSDTNKRRTLGEDDARLAEYSDDQKQALLARFRAQQRSDPDVLVEETNAITCRVATSFARVGHLDLFSRRVVKEGLQREDADSKYDTTSVAWQQYEAIIRHAIAREFPQIQKDKGDDLLAAATDLLRESAKGISAMVAGWVRVGFTQGNFNGDNCLIAGRTMDYGPFGWVDEYHPLFAKWTGSGDHFGFMNQPTAGYANFAVLVKALEPLFEVHEKEPVLQTILESAREEFQSQLDQVFRIKLGFHPRDDSGAPERLWQELEPLLQTSRVDWTLFWRQLTRVALEYPLDQTTASPTDADMMRVLEASANHDDDNNTDQSAHSPFYVPLTNAERRGKFLAFLKQWRQALVESYGARGASTTAGRFTSTSTPSTPAQVMLQANPKYVLREYMLVDAYNQANAGNFSGVNELLNLMQHPYDEGTPQQEAQFYRRTSNEALSAGGTAYMS